jgi:hypothetical protein
MAVRSDFESWEAFAEAQGLQYRLELGDLIRDLGGDFVSFVLAMPSRALRDAIPSQAQRDVISELTEQSLAIKKQQADPHYRKLAFLTRVCGYEESLGTSRATNWHQRSGGDVPDSVDLNSFEGVLAIVVKDIISARLFSSDLTLYQLIDVHPLFEALTNFLLDDNDPIGQMFREAVDEADELGAELYGDFPFLAQIWHKMSMSSVSGSLELADILETVIVEAHVRQFNPKAIIADVQDAVRDNLRVARQLAQREVVTVPTYIGIVGMELADEVGEVAHADVVIRRSNPLDVGCLNRTENVPIIAELPTEISLEEAKWQRPYFGQTAATERLREFADQPRSRSARTNAAAQSEQRIRQQVERLKFSLLLCSDGRLAAKDKHWHTLNPLSRITLQYSRYIDDFNVVGSNSYLTVDIASAFVYWWDKAGNVPKSLQIGMRRLLKAAAERDDSVDVLVDAVVAWENLFGSVPETVFRVTGAMAILLEPDDLVKRASVLKVLKNLYNHRSKLVHGALDVGSPKFGPEVVRQEAVAALTIGLEAYRRMLDNEDLASLSNSEARASRLLLGL